MARKHPRIKKIKLHPSGIVHVHIPKGVVPVVAHDPVQSVVQIVPVKKAKTWWQSLFDVKKL
jgi:hypothetical protein